MIQENINHDIQIVDELVFLLNYHTSTTSYITNFCRETTNTWPGTFINRTIVEAHKQRRPHRSHYTSTTTPLWFCCRTRDTGAPERWNQWLYSTSEVEMVAPSHVVRKRLWHSSLGILVTWWSCNHTLESLRAHKEYDFNHRIFWSNLMQFSIRDILMKPSWRSHVQPR